MRKTVLLACSMTLLSGTASAHIALDAPRVRDATMKTPPCGGASVPGASPTTFRPGQTVTVSWHETVQHPGFFRIAFSADGRTFPADPTDPPAAAAFPVLAIIPKAAGVTAYSAEITLPDTECSACALQVIQYMQEHAPPPYYYQCADIVLSNDAPASGGSGGGGSGGSGGSGPVAAAPAEEPMDESGCGCRISQRGANGELVTAVGAAALALWARRRRITRVMVASRAS